MERRDFFKKAGFAAGGFALASTPVIGKAAPTKTETSPEGIPLRQFGKKGPKLPVIGFGGASLPKKWGNPFSWEDRIKNLQAAYRKGIRYYDTSPDYGESSDLMGEALEKVRKNIFLVTKVDHITADKTRGEVESELKRLRTDHLDGIMIHGSPALERMTFEQALKVRDVLFKLRDEKVVKQVGISAHSYYEKALPVIAEGGLDFCMLACGYFPRADYMRHSARQLEYCRACIAKAHQQETTVVAMKVMGAGTLSRDVKKIVPAFPDAASKEVPHAAVRYCLADPRISMLCIGMHEQRNMDDNIATAKGDTTYTLEDRRILAEYSVQALESEPIKKLREDA